MAKFGPNQPCPCFSERKYKKCCGPIHRGRPASSPESLMRSRFSAYSIGLVEHIITTTDPSGPHWSPDSARWKSDIRHFMDSTQFMSLEVIDSNTEAETGWVHFSAQLHQGGSAHELSEKSHFVKHGESWTYHAAKDED
jgi:SEC-C motif-containing protein